MTDDDELEMLLGEIPRATSSLNLPHVLSNAPHHHSNLVDHGYGYNVHGAYSNESWKHKYACASSPVIGFSLHSDGSSSSLFSSGGGSSSDVGLQSPPQFEEVKPHLISGNGSWSDIKKANERNLIDYFNLPGNFSKMYVSDKQEGALVHPNGLQFCDQSQNDAIQIGLENCGLSHEYMKGFSDCRGFNPSVPREPIKSNGEVKSTLLQMQNDQTMANLLGSCYSHSKSDILFCRTDFSNNALDSQFYRTNTLSNGNFSIGVAVPDVSPSLDNTSVGGSLFCPSHKKMNQVDAGQSFYSRDMIQVAQPYCKEEYLLRYQTTVRNGSNKVPLHVGVPQGSVEAFTREDNFIIQGEGMNYGIKREALPKVYNIKSIQHKSGEGKTQQKSSQLDGHLHNAAVQDTVHSPDMYGPFILPSKCSPLAEAQGYIYHIAKNQHGCRLLQRLFDEGTSLDVQIIFNGIIDHTAELMMNPFGNYLMQKLLEVCDEEQRMHILLKATEEPGELVRISLNTHGTRVIQKLIETLTTRQQISLVILALEPGFITLIKDLNGNHVIQRCLQCFTSEDSKFIFVAAAKHCIDIATHQHGCCVLQRCISYSRAEHRENLVAEISEHGLLLAQDAFGNYVVQFVLELKIPCATSKLTSQFEGKYVHLSTQKFSSHVVEKCLVVCNDEVRSKIIHELLSATYFDQLLQDPHANYVVQTAVRVSEGHLHKSLVDAILSYKAISRNSPYSKRIFSHKLLQR